jgi:hypothetical protein
MWECGAWFVILREANVESISEQAAEENIYT